MKDPGDSDERRDSFFGELYYESTVDLLSERMSRAEAALMARLLRLGPEDRCLDLGCGHGRHMRAHREAGSGRLVGLDRSLPYLRLASGPPGEACKAAEGSPAGIGEERARPPRAPRPFAAPMLVCGDLRRLPFADETFDCAYSWYSALFLFEDAAISAVLREAARVLGAGGRLLHHGSNPERLRREPLARHQGRTRSGCLVEEEAAFDPSSGRERLFRRLTRPDGEVLEGTWEVRHYRPDELEPLLVGAGLRLSTVHDESGEPFDEAKALDMIAVATKA